MADHLQSGDRGLLVTLSGSSSLAGGDARVRGEIPASAAKGVANSLGRIGNFPDALLNAPCEAVLSGALFRPLERLERFVRLTAGEVGILVPYRVISIVRVKVLHRLHGVPVRIVDGRIGIGVFRAVREGAPPVLCKLDLVRRPLQQTDA